MKKVFTILFTLLLCAAGTSGFAHPGSGIVIDKNGQIFFTDTGQGVWKIDKQGKLTYIQASRFHWMTIDEMGYFADTQKNFGEFFERVTPQNSKPALLMCSDFPLVVNRDGDIYYADTRPDSPGIMRRTPSGKESVLAAGKSFQNIGGVAAGPDGSLYVTHASGAISRIAMDGKVSIFATYDGRTDRTDLPYGTVPSYCRGLDVDSLGMVYVAATGSRSVLKITPQGVVTTIMQVPGPWSPTGVALFKGEVYVLEWHDVEPALEEDRRAWIPRVRKIGRDGKITTLATVSR